MSMSSVLAAALRQNLVSFLQKAFITIVPGEPFIPNWHIEAIAHELMRVREGKARRLIINQPPRTLKSIATSVAFPAFLLGHDPSFRIICVSYSNDLASELHRQFRMVVDAPWYRELFPEFAIKRDRDLELVTTRGGGRTATSVGGTLTGRGANLIIIDDPMKAEEALSEPARRRVVEWFTSTLISRLNDQARDTILVVMQRVHEEDLSGHLLEQESWQHLNLPAIAPASVSIPIENGRFHNWREGEPLDAVRFPKSVLEGLKADIGSLKFSAQFLQSPVPTEGNLIRRDCFRWYDSPPDRQPGDQIIQSWDIASTISDAGDWTAGTTWLKRRNDFYLIDVARGRWEFPEVRRQVIAAARFHAATTILVEQAGPGLNLLQDLRATQPARVPRPIGIVPQGSKADRMAAQACRIEAGQVHLPSDAPWLAVFVNELLAFPQGKHDDQVDSVSQFLNWASARQVRQRIAVHGVEVIPLE